MKLSDDQFGKLIEFWKGVWEVQGECKPGHPALKEWRKQTRRQTREAAEEESLDREEAWERALKKMAGWKAPVPDGIEAYWWKAFRGLGLELKEMFWRMSDGEAEIPQWLVTGRTVMVPKGECMGEPHQFRPIACLNTAYKAYTGALTMILMHHAEATNIIPMEQKALRKGQRGCLDALMVDETVAMEAKLNTRDLAMGWVDYQKAYDRVPHKWLRGVLKSVRAPRMVRRAVDALIPLWQTDVTVATSRGTKTAKVKLLRGLFQGD